MLKLPENLVCLSGLFNRYLKGVFHVKTMALELKKSEDEIEYLVKYFPYWIYPEGEKRKNPKFDFESGKVLDLKNRDKQSIAYFLYWFKSVIKDQPYIAIVPSHDPEKRQSGIRDLAKQLIEKGIVLDATLCLKRTKLIPKLAAGGDRKMKVHLDSIVVESVELIKDQNILLLDDVTTTGNSLKACKQLLLKTGAKSVRCFAIGKTHWE